MGKETSTFGNIEIEKNKFYRRKIPIFLKDVNIEKVKRLHIMLRKTSAYLKRYDGQTKWMYFLIENDDLLEKHTVLDKVSADIKKESDSEPVYNKTFLKTRIKSYGDDVTDFYDKEIPKVDSNHTCLAVISLDSALKKEENYYPQVFLKSENTLRKKHINDNLRDFSSSDECDEE